MADPSELTELHEPVDVRRRGATLVITLNRPEVRNAINGAMAAGLAAALDELDEDPSLVVGVLTGAGGVFSAGMDLKAFLEDGQRPEVPGRGLAGLTRTPPRKPLIAAVEGFAVAGGFELVLACDLVVAARDAKFSLPEVKRGLIAGSGGLLRLPRLMPQRVAMEYALTGEMLSAEDAFRWGLVNRLAEPAQALDVAVDLAMVVARNAPLAVRVTKEIIAHAQEWPSEHAWARQDELLDDVLASPDSREGAAAFVDKREPRWQGLAPT